MATQRQSRIWGCFWQIIDQSKKLIEDYEQVLLHDELCKKLPHIHTAYIDSLIVHVAKIFSKSSNEPFRLGEFKTICRNEIKKELENIENTHKDTIGKIITNRNQLIAHLDENFYELCFSKNEIIKMEQSMAKFMDMELQEAKAVYASMPRTEDKSKERYSILDFREDFPEIKDIIKKLDEIWGRSIPFAELENNK